VWVANSLDLSVSKIDPRTARVTATIGVGDGPHAIAASGGGVWVSDEFDATLDRIDPRAGRVAHTVSVGSSPRGIALTRSGIWVAARPFAAAAHRGGTLTVVANVLPVRDPALPYDPIGIPALATVYDGLVALRRSGGAQGFTLVPDLAVTLPRPTDGGKAYTFTLRRGIRYSTGAPVRASDFRRGIQRQLSFGAAPLYYEGILGAQACHPRRCDLSAGIVTNNAAGTVTFHLGQADPDFLYKLSLLLATPAPPGAPGHPIDRAPFLPGTGPYKISAYRPNVALTLVRNPYFRQWPYAAQPAGYPNVIRFEQMADPRKQQSAVETGAADLVDISWNGLPYRPLAVRYPTRVHPGVKIFTIAFFLNTRLPPFTNTKARQAVNYAIDRDQIITFLHLGSPGQATVTCQILPAGFPSFQRYCPHTAGTKDGTWHAPDLTKAVQLAHESGTTGMPVTIWNCGGKPLGAYLVKLLGRLGYRAAVHDLSCDRFWALPPTAIKKIQMGGIWGFGADFPTASDFFLPVLTCRSPGGMGLYCNPQADKLASQAQAAQLTDPAAARKLWAQADRIVTDQAPWVSIFNESPTVFVSARAGNYQESPYYGPVLDQIWVR
jgi:YVTN family beta-propeller protein